MKTRKNVQLKQYTTIRIGGVAKTMLIPETVNELTEIMNLQKNIFFLGGGRICWYPTNMNLSLL